MHSHRNEEYAFIHKHCGATINVYATPPHPSIRQKTVGACKHGKKANMHLSKVF
jgi:hypothetical protein